MKFLREMCAATTKRDDSNYLLNIYLISSFPTFLLCGLNSCAFYFYFYDAYNPRIQADRNLSTFSIPDHKSYIFFQDCLPHAIWPFYLNTCMPFSVLVLETSTCTIFFYTWLCVYFLFCILVPFK